MNTSGASGGESPFGPDQTPYAALGGEAPLRRLVDAFYDRMDASADFATIRSLHPAELTTSRTKLFEFLSGWLGGPPLYIERYGHPRLRGRHMPFPIGETERDQWLACMQATLDEVEVDEPLRAFLTARFAHVANFMRNQEPV
ncbi:MAG: group II truncated hemoglobin [Phycisphaerales bacterium]|nr:group II truncated hemoglobin [Phycisphaerae bacterium]NNM24802.1 group II truncated hemoglobin [Phycisphaerales bacterium]